MDDFFMTLTKLTMETPLGPKPIKAYKGDFLGSRAGRQVRVMCEMGDSEERLALAGIEGTVLFFGSARYVLEPSVGRILR